MSSRSFKFASALYKRDQPSEQHTSCQRRPAREFFDFFLFFFSSPSTSPLGFQLRKQTALFASSFILLPFCWFVCLLLEMKADVHVQSESEDPAGVAASPSTPSVFHISSFTICSADGSPHQRCFWLAAPPRPCELPARPERLNVAPARQRLFGRADAPLPSDATPETLHTEALNGPVGAPVISPPRSLSFFE